MLVVCLNCHKVIICPHPPTHYDVILGTKILESWTGGQQETIGGFYYNQVALDSNWCNHSCLQLLTLFAVA